MTGRLRLLILVGLFYTCPAWSAVQRFAVIVGNNQGARGDTELLYAESDARKVAKGEFENKSAWFRFWARVSRLTAPVQ